MVPLVFINAKYLKNDALAYTVLEVFFHLNKFSSISFNVFLFFQCWVFTSRLFPDCCCCFYTIINISIISIRVILIDEYVSG